MEPESKKTDWIAVVVGVAMVVFANGYDLLCVISHVVVTMGMGWGGLIWAMPRLPILFVTVPVMISLSSNTIGTLAIVIGGNVLGILLCIQAGPKNPKKTR